jgi:hypothetical protein
MIQKIILREDKIESVILKQNQIYIDMLEYIKEDYDDGKEIYQRFIERLKEIEKEILTK